MEEECWEDGGFRMIEATLAAISVLVGIPLLCFCFIAVYRRNLLEALSATRVAFLALLLFLPFLIYATTGIMLEYKTTNFTLALLSLALLVTIICFIKKVCF